MKVLRKKVDEPWELVEIDNTLESLQNEVGGLYRTVTITQDACIVFNEKGAFNSLRFNVRLFGLQLFGTVLIVGVSGEEFCDLPAPEIWVKMGEKKNEG